MVFVVVVFEPRASRERLLERSRERVRGLAAEGELEVAARVVRAGDAAAASNAVAPRAGAEHLQRHGRGLEDAREREPARPAGRGEGALVEPQQAVGGEKRDALDVLLRDRAGEAAEGGRGELQVRLLQDPELQLLGREHGAPAARQRHTVQKQHGGRRAEGSDDCGHPAGADGAQRKFDDRAKIESRVPRSNLPVFLHLTLGGKDS